MASGKYNYFVSYQVQTARGNVIQQKNCFMELNQLLASESDVRSLVFDLEESELLKEGERVYLVSFTQLTGGFEH